MKLRDEKVDKHLIKPGKQTREIKVDDYLRNLADSMVKDGQLQPIGLLEDMTLIWGFRRHAAALLRPEITHLDAAIFGREVSEQQFLAMRAAENFQRVELSAYERWQSVEELARINPAWTNADLATFLHVSAATITHLRSPGKCLPVIQEALKSGQVSIADTYALSRMDADQQHTLFTAKLEGISAAEVTHRARKVRNGKPDVQVSKLGCPLPSGAVVQVTLPGKGGIEEALEAVQEWSKEARRALEQGLDAKTFQAVMKDKAKKG
jgi:ParB/RepB/Spo0J family partition protein